MVRRAWAAFVFMGAGYTPQMRKFQRITVYCGSSDQVADHYKTLARSVGQSLAQSGIDVVYGGGRVGLMGQVADGALEAGGRVYGVIPRKLQQLEVGHNGCTELFVVEDMHTRKSIMASMGDAFIALPGGWGTLEEIFEMTTWTLLGYQDKPVGLISHRGFYDALLGWITHASGEGFIRPAHADLLYADPSLDGLLHKLALAPTAAPKVTRPA